MQRRPLVLAIYDPKWFMRVIELARRRGIVFSHFYSREEVPYGSVVYTDYGPIAKELESRDDVLVIYDPLKSCKMFEDSVLASMLSSGYRSIVVGIDPGSTLSYVIIGDNELLLYDDGNMKSLDRDLEYVLKCVTHEEIKVKVGTGHRCAEVIEHIKKTYPGLPIELVDETSTSPSISRIGEVLYSAKKLRGIKPFRHKDVYAAYRIAMAQGMEVL